MTVNAQKLRELPGNDRCADCQDCDCPDCGFPDPVWACEELGIMVCEECMDLHTLLTRASFKSIICQDWTQESFQKMASTSNKASKEMYEKHLSPAYKKPTRCFNLEFRRQWIMSKYVRKEFMAAEDLPSYLQGKKAGYLWKLGRDSQVFLRRWFVLDPSGKGTLRYYTDANEQSLRGEISLFQMNMALAPQEKIRHPNGLQIVCPDNKGQNTRMIYLYAELAKDMVEWFQAVRCLKYNIQKMKAVGKDEHLIRRILQYDILKEGYLLKTGAKGKEAFRKRWIILDKVCLMYFKEPLDANPKGTIPMKSGYSLILSGQLDPEHRGFHFFLKTPGRTFHFIAESDHERRAWFAAIHAACNRYSGAGTKLKATDNLAAMRLTATPSPPTVQQTSPKPKPKAAAPDKEDQRQDKDEEDEILSRPFVGVRASTKPRPKHTLPEYHKQGQGHAAGHGRYRTAAEPKLEGTEEIVEDDYITFEFQRHEESGDAEESSESSHRHAGGQGLRHQEAVEVYEEDYIEFTSADPNDPDTEDSSEEDEESPYIELDGENVVLMQKVDIVGMTTKQLSTHLKVPRGALPQSSSCTMCVSLVWNTVPNVPGTEECVCVSPIVSCCSMPRNVMLLHPYQLEIQHSAILKDVTSCKPIIGHLNKEPGKFFKWEKMDQSSVGTSCKVSPRNFVLETTSTGCFAIMVPTEDVAGKMIRCMTYISSEQGDNHLVARVYFFQDNGSDDILHELQRRENTYSGRLCDISRSFFLANTKDNILMTLSDMDGMEMYFGGNEPMPIAADELWQKQLVCYMVEIIKKGQEGQCTINVWQENTASEKQPIQMNLHYSNQAKYSVVAPQPLLHTPMQQLLSVPMRCHKAVTRVSSEPLTQKPFIADRSRDDRHARSVPSRSRAADCSPLQGGVLPFSLKRDLFLLLDVKVATGNDWRMLASQLGLDSMIYCFDMQINPTMEVLKAFEIMNRPIKELEEHLRHMGRDDAADVIKTYIQSIKKENK